MDTLHLSHLGFLFTWAGVVGAEFVVELSATDESTRLFAARAHFWIDVLIEVWLLLGVLVTGTLLTARMWPVAGLLAVKILCGLTAVTINLYCLVMVVQRYRWRAEPARVLALRRRVILSGLGLPFGLTAAVIGLGGGGETRSAPGSVEGLRIDLGSRFESLADAHGVMVAVPEGRVQSAPDWDQHVAGRKFWETRPGARHAAAAGGSSP